MRMRLTCSIGSRSARRLWCWRRGPATRRAIHAWLSRADATSIELKARGKRERRAKARRFLLPLRAFWLRREQLLPFRPVERLVERAGKLVKQLVDLSRLDDQRRTDRDHIAGDE